MSEPDYQGIAIIGIAGRFPGAETVEEFWANLVAGKESIAFFSDAELTEAGLDPELLRSRGNYVAARGVLNDADCFDAAFFGVHPKEAEVMDPQQRVFLEACWTAMERAGYAPGRLSGVVGVFAGATFNTYYERVLQKHPELIELVGSELVMFGNERDYLTTRVAYKLGLNGPALNVSTACSTSLVAVCQACQALMTYQCDIALAGGVSVRVPQTSGFFHDDGNIGSADGHTRSFDAQASGTAFSNGVGVVVLKRLDAAVEDGDHIYAVIKGAALNNDGANRVSFGAPGVEGQSEVIAMAHALAGVEAESITYVEAHGTATPLGDPIEIAGLTRAFRAGTAAKQFCGIGSVKSNIGHLDAAAGVTGLIKTALALKHRLIPASLHFTKPNPRLDIENSPFYVNATLQKWETKSGISRRAGVSSFGTGGTNAHVVIEETPELPLSGASRDCQLLLISAKTADALAQSTTNLAGHLHQIAQESDAARVLADTAFTLQIGRSEFTHRRIAVCSDASEAATLLKSLDSKRVFTHHQQVVAPPVVFMFPGQGAQYAGMGAELYRSEPVFRAEVDRCAELLLPSLGDDLRTILFPTPVFAKEAEQLLSETRFTQPALFVMEYALARLWMSWGIHPAAMIGHSVGEYVAGCLAGVFALEDALRLVAQRGALVQSLLPGGMLAVRLPEHEVLPLLNGDLAIAAINSPTACVISGPHHALARLRNDLESRHVAVRPLHASHAFHSPMMDPVLPSFTELLRAVNLGEPQIPYVSNTTARWITPAEAGSIEYWSNHIRQTVRFSDGVAELMKDSKGVLLEVGPGQTLSTLARQHPIKSADQLVLSSLPPAGTSEQRGLLETLGRLWMAGSAVDWAQFYAGERRSRIVLPTYPFERKRYWPVPSGSESQAQPNSLEATLQEIQQAPNAAPEAPPAETPATGRKERLLEAVRLLLHELSGYELTHVDPTVNLLELGLDSLLLTQASQLLQRKFGVNITFRQLMEELDSIEAIASHLNTVLPAEAIPVAPVPLTITPSITTQIGNPPILEQLWQQHQQLTAQLMQALGRQNATLPPSPNSVPLSSIPVATPKQEFKSHGPFKPIERAGSAPLSAGQSHALNALIARYTERTKRSKKIAAANRPILADPRSVAGFKQTWKEIVYPIVTNQSEGSRVWDVDGNEYVDFVMGFGASLFGHRPEFVVQAVHEQLDRGFEIGPLHPLAGEVATLIRTFTGMDRVGFTNTGSEAVLAATRMARTVTGRDKIAVFAGAYHGIFDEVLFRPLMINGETRTAPIAPGIPASALSEVIVLDYGNPNSIEILRARGREIAAVLVEPVQSRRLELQPRQFLHDLRLVTRETGSALVFDEVVTGFRVHPGGAQAYFDVRADLATYGKVIGGGLPIGVVAGDPKYMDALDGGQWQYGDSSFPEVGVTFFAGTFVRHPLALAAAKAVLTHLKTSGPELQRQLADRTARTAHELQAIINEFGAPYQVSQFSSLMQLTFPADQKLAGLLFYLLRERGIHAWENRAFVITTAHTDADLARLTSEFRNALTEMQAQEFIPRLPLAAPAPFAAAIQPPASAPFPLTEAQKEIWLAAQMGGAAAAGFNESISLDFRGNFDEELFRSAVHQVVERHPIVFARFSADGQSQKITSERALDIPLFDFTGDAAEEQRRNLEKVIDRETSEIFDLTRGPLLRVRIVRLSRDHHVVVWTAHHIVCDGWSGGLLIGEIARIYSSRKQGVHAALEEPASFRDYALASVQNTPAVQDAMNYWRDQFAVMPPPLDLPTDHARPAVRSAEAATTRQTLDPRLLPALKHLARQQRTTTVVLLLATLKTLLHRMTGQTDLVIGLGAAGQAITGQNCLTGHCLNMLPIRTRLDADASFQESLVMVKKSVLDAYDRHQCTLGNILQNLKVLRTPARPPLVEVIFNVDRDPGDENFAGLEFKCDRNPKRALHFDLFFNFVEGSRGLLLECDYNSELFEAATIDRWLRHFETLLESITATPAGQIGKLPVLTESERRQITEGWNATGVEYPQDRCLFEYFDEQVERTPNAPAVACENRRLSYRELNARANQLAHHLRKRGVGPETLVAVLMDRSIEMVVSLMGITKAGGAYVPLDPEYPADRLRMLFEDLRAPIVLTQQRYAPQIPDGQAALALDITDWTTLAAEPQTNPPRLTGSTNAVYVIYTSGSTGKPKGVINIHEGIVNRLLWMQDAYRLNSSDTVLQKTPYTFDVSVWEFFWPLITGACLVMARPGGHKDLAYLTRTIDQYRITTLHFVPSMLELFLEAPGLENLKSLRRVICSGEALGFGVQQRFFDRLPAVELHNLYGPTEASVDVTHWTCRRESKYPFVPIGRPIANTQIYVTDRYLNPVPIGVPGELLIGGIGVARGYLNRDELTAERFIPNCFRSAPAAQLYKTGDLVRFLPDGNIEYFGRLDNQVKIRGLRIELGEIESVIEQQPEVRQAVVVVREDTAGDKRIIAYVVPVDPSHTSLEGLLRDTLKRSLPDYMVPAVFVLLGELPLLSNGKVNRKALPAPIQNQTHSGEEVVAPRTETENALAAIWMEVLNAEVIGITDNFFDLGGHSLLAIRVVSRIRDVFELEITPQSFFTHPTIMGLAALLIETNDQPGNVRRIRAAQQSGPVSLSFAQERIWFLHQLAPDSPAYNIVDVIHLEGPVSTGVVRQSLISLAGRHEALRTVFSEICGEPRQTVLPEIEIAVPELDLRGIKDTEQQSHWVSVGRGQGRKPFDLSIGPLFRTTLVHLSDDAHLLLLTIHHIVVDEWSMEVLHRELQEIYEAFRREREPRLSPLPIQYTDFSVWQRDCARQETYAKQLAYWKDELRGAPGKLELQTDRPRPPMQSFRGAVEAFRLPKDLQERVKALARQEQATLFMSLCAAFMALMNRYSGQNDVLVGTPISGRTQSETEHLIGLFLNTVVLRARFEEGLTFRSLVRQVRGAALGAYGHQDLPFEQLVAEVSTDRHPSYAPLFQVMFVLFGAGAASEASNAASLQQFETGTSKFDLTFSVSETEAGLYGVVEYATDLFEAETIKRLCGHYGTLLESAVENPDLELSRLQLLSAAERHRLLHDWNATALSDPDRYPCVHQMIEDRARQVPEKDAVVFQGSELAYVELNRRANQLAHYMTRRGVRPGMLVGLLFERSIDMVIALLATLKAGAAYVPLDHGFPENRLLYMVEDSSMQALISHRGVQAKLSTLPPVIISLDSEAEVIATESTASEGLPATNGEMLAYVLYTSGSTGKPKGVEIQHRALANFLMSMKMSPGFTSNDVLLAVTTLSFDIAGLEIYLPLISGGRVVIASSTDAHDPVQLMRRMDETHPTVMQATPATWRALLDAGWKGSPHLKVLCGGEALHPDLALKLLPCCGELWNMYGPTETTIWSTLQRVSTVSGSVPIGSPIGNTQIYILDSNQTLLPQGVPGELYIGGAGLAKGYLGHPELTDARFVPNPFGLGSRLYRTGDLAYWTREGNLECLGRMDNQVKVRGFRIELGEIEAVLAEHEDVAQCVVGIHIDHSADKSLVAYIHPRRGSNIAIAELRTYVKKQLPEYMVPSAFVFMEQFPLTPNGKVDRKALPAPEDGRTHSPSDGATPQDPIERMLVGLWSRLLKRRRVSVKDNFFEIGGHSLLAVRVMVEIEKLYGMRLPLATLLGAPTIAELAAILRSTNWTPSWQSLVSIRPGGDKPPLFLMHSHGGNVLEYYPLVERVDPDQPVYALQARGLDGKIVRDPSIEEMASAYIQEVRSLQPLGPYYLGGFCFGGLLALEVAQQLVAAGEEVGLLVMIQTITPATAVFDPNTTLLEQWWYRIAKRLDLERENFLSRGPAHVKELWGKLQSLARARLAVGADRMRTGVSHSMDYIIAALGHEHDKAYEKYTPKPYFGNVLVIRAARQLRGLLTDAHLGWEGLLLGKSTFCTVPGHQQNLLTEPNVSFIGESLADALEEAYARDLDVAAMLTA